MTVNCQNNSLVLKPRQSDRSLIRHVLTIQTPDLSGIQIVNHCHAQDLNVISFHKAPSSTTVLSGNIDQFILLFKLLGPQAVTCQSSKYSA